MDINIYRQIPKMDKLMALPGVQKASEGLPRPMVRSAIQDTLDRLRHNLRSGASLPDADALEAMLISAVHSAGNWQLRRVINATGIVLHTNLGRAPLGSEIAAHIAETAEGYSTLEYDLENGCRGSRYSLVERQFCRITGAEAAMVVNNNAAAVFLMLNTLAAGKRVAVSRGELVEIGGAFRVPEIMSASGAELLEIGATNKTHAADYEKALSCENTGALLKVHTSNFKILGFFEEVSIEELARIASEHRVPLLYDLGAGFLVRPETLDLHDGIYIPDAVKYADVCCFSGDKLFGAGQAGILLGKAEYIERMKRNQLARMLRVDKMTLASLEAVLRLYEEPDMAKQLLPVLRMLSTKQSELKQRADKLAISLADVCKACSFTAVPCTDEPGGGSLPATELPGWAVSVASDACSIARLEAKLRALPIPVIARISKDRLLLSVRALLPEDEVLLVQSIAALEVDE